MQRECLTGLFWLPMTARFHGRPSKPTANAPAFPVNFIKSDRCGFYKLIFVKYRKNKQKPPRVSSGHRGFLRFDHSKTFIGGFVIIILHFDGIQVHIKNSRPKRNGCIETKSLSKETIH